MRKPQLFIWKVSSIYRIASSPILIFDVSSLHHKTLDYPVKDVSFVAQILSFFTCTQTSKVFGRLWDLCLEQLKDHSTLVLPLANFNVKINLGILRIKFRKL